MSEMDQIRDFLSKRTSNLNEYVSLLVYAAIYLPMVGKSRLSDLD